MSLNDKITAYTEARERSLDPAAPVEHLAALQRTADELGADLLRAIAQEALLDKADPWRSEATCPDCDGSGWTGVYGEDLATCRTCRAAGTITRDLGQRITDGIREVAA